jgi:hypothetical protein
MDSKHTVKNVNFWNGFTGSDIGGFAEQPSGLYARWIQLGVFILLSNTRQVIMEIRSHGHLMKRLILLENLLTYVTSCYHTYIPCFGNILKRILCLNH